MVAHAFNWLKLLPLHLLLLLDVISLIFYWQLVVQMEHPPAAEALYPVAAAVTQLLLPPGAAEK